MQVDRFSFGIYNIFLFVCPYNFETDWVSNDYA